MKATPRCPLNRIRGYKRGVFTMTKLLIGVIVFSLFVLILGGFYVQMMNSYNVPVSERYKKSYDKISKMSNVSTSIGEQLQGGELTDANAFVLAGKDIYSVGQIFLNAITLPYEIIKEFQQDNEIPIHPAFLTALISILVIVVSFGVFSFLARWVG